MSGGISDLEFAGFLILLCVVVKRGLDEILKDLD